MNKIHIPVMPNEVLQALALTTGDNTIDATLGLGGHAQLILEVIGPQGRLLGIERTAEGLATAKQNLAKWQQQVDLVQADFRDLEQIAIERNFNQSSGILFDLGLASWQIDRGYKGLSFMIDAPIDMRLTQKPKELLPSFWTQDQKLISLMNHWSFRPAATFLNQAHQEEIAYLLYTLADIRYSRQLAQRIVESRINPIMTTGDLVRVLQIKSPKVLAPIFQALRIMVNNEFAALAKALDGAWRVVKVGGRIVILSFQSTEHRIVKFILRQIAGGRKIHRMFPSKQEIRSNARSRSATLRYIIKN